MSEIYCISISFIIKVPVINPKIDFRLKLKVCYMSLAVSRKKFCFWLKSKNVRAT